MNKSDYVRSHGQTRQHSCHWPGCGKQVPIAMWVCRQHWFMLPKYLRERIWETYMPEQEISMDLSEEYLAAAQAVKEWVAQHMEGSS